MISDSSLISGMTAGSEWTPITKDLPADIEVFVDLKSINRISNNAVRAWIKYRYSTPRSFGSKYVKELAVHNEYYCSERKYKILRSEAYFTDGTHEPDFSERQGYVLADDAAYKYLCK
jgi:hypothetical protein